MLISRLGLIAMTAAVLTVIAPYWRSLPPAPPPPLTCTPYLPDGGLFYNTGINFNRVTMTPVQVGLYSISLNNQNQVTVIQGNTASADAQISVPSGMLAFYYFYGANNRFLVLDLHTDPSTSPLSINYQQVIVDLTAWSLGQPPQSGHLLSPVSQATTAQLHIYPSPGYTASSPGNGLAFFVWYGLGNNQVADAGIYRSDNGAQLCFVPSFTTSVQVIAKVTTTSVQILDGSTVIQSCALPRGFLQISPPSQSFGTIAANTTATRSFTFSNTGNDCLTVTAISSSAHFQPSNFPSSGLVLLAGGSQPVSVVFNPAGAVGTFAEVLSVTSNPAQGSSSVGVSGISVPPALLTVTKTLTPTTDPGRFNLQIDGVTKAANIGNGGSTGPQPIMVLGAHTVSETAGTGTNLLNYASSINCGAGPVSTTSLTVSLAQGDNKTCTIANLGPPRLTVNKVVQPSGDSGIFNLQIDGVTAAANIGTGGSTGPQLVSLGTHIVSETAGTGTNLANYVTSVDCGSGPVNSTSVSVSMVPGDNRTCTITNLGPPRLTVNKILQPPGDSGLFNLQIDGVTKAASVGNGGSTGSQVMSLGPHTVGETAAAGANLADYTISIDCGTGPVTGSSTTVSLSSGDNKVCNIKNASRTISPPTNLQAEPHM